MRFRSSHRQTGFLRPLIFILTLLLSGRQSLSGESTELGLRATYRRLEVAYQEKDLKVLWYLQTADYTHQYSDGSIHTRVNDYENNFRNFKAFKKLDSWKIILVKIQISGGQTMVTVQHEVRGTVEDDHHHAKQIYVKATAEDLWVSKGKNWYLKKTKDIEEKILGL